MTAPTVPMAAQIALARAVINSRPSDQSARDYILSLRRSITQKNDDASFSPQLCSERYWQSEAQRLQAELDALKLENQRLRMGTGQHTFDSNDPTDAQRYKKRSASSLQAPNKRLRMTSGFRDTDDKAVCPMRSAVEELTTCLGQLYFVQQRPHTTAKELEIQVCRASVAMKGVLSAVMHEDNSTPSSCTQPNSLHNDDDNLMTGIFRACARCFMGSLQAYDQLDLLQATQSQMAQVVTHFAAFFDTGLEALTRLATEQANNDRLPLDSDGRAETRKDLKRSCTSRQDSINSDIETDLAQHMISTFATLDPTKQHHAHLFEVFTFHLLTRLGAVTGVLAGVNSCMASGATITHGSGPTGKDEEPTRRRHAVRLGRHLLAILRTALSVAPRSFRIASARARSAVSQPQRKDDLPLYSRHNLNTTSLAKLQRTLVQATLGDTSPLDAAAEYLVRPALPDPVVTGSKAKSRKGGKNATDTEKSIMQELWDCLGWEILSYEGRLAEWLREEGASQSED